MAAPTLQNVVDLAREDLNDAAKTRYADSVLLKHANDGLDAMLMGRPDLFIGQFTTMQDGAQFALGDNLPVEGRFKRVLADYIVFRAESKDDDAVNAGRAELMAKLFQAELS